MEDKYLDKKLKKRKIFQVLQFENTRLTQNVFYSLYVDPIFIITGLTREQIII